MEFDHPSTVQKHSRLLESQVEHDTAEQHRLSNTPILLAPVLSFAREQQPPAVFSHGLLASFSILSGPSEIRRALSEVQDRRIFSNTTAPSSTFICGSQGSGKSHTLSCLLENSLLNSDAAIVPELLTGLVCHYDTFLSDEGGSPCEAAFLASAGIPVRVLCSAANLRTIKVSKQI